jgi:hypothetical protein
MTRRVRHLPCDLGRPGALPDGISSNHSASASLASIRHIHPSSRVIRVTDQLGPVRQSRRAAAERKEDKVSVMMVRQKVKDGSAEEAEAAARELFATLNRVRPEGLRYASTRVVDSSTFVALIELADGIEDPRPAIPEYLRFLEQLKGWVDGPLVIERLDVVGSYNLFAPRARNLPFDARSAPGKDRASGHLAP